ncbi:hypothetical protein ACROYT_G000566 [Oculina patagonica]
MEPTKSSEMIISDSPGITFGSKLSKERIVTLVVLAVAVIILIVGVVLIAVAAGDKKTAEKESGSISKQDGDEKTTTLTPTATTGPSSRCDFSEEAKRVGLDGFLNRVKETYYTLHPYEVHLDPDASTESIKVEYAAYDPTPSVIKNRTDISLALFKEINETRINTNALKHRERKALAKVKHFLQHVFGQPYDVNYYAGDWMLGPNNRCLQEICNHGNAVSKGLGRHHKPYSVADVELIGTKLKTHKAGILQYIDNMKMGVRKGMVRTVEECEAGSLAINRRYLNVFLYGSTGVLKESFVQPMLDPDYYSNITQEIDSKWKKTHNGKNVSKTVKEYLVTYLGEPLNQLLRYIKEEHSRHCVPSNASSGWATLPLKYVWLDGKENTSWPTEPFLPTGEPLNGSLAYSQILSYFTTNDITPMEVQELGKEQLSTLYPMVMSMLEPKTIQMFHFTGDKATTPTCPIEMDLNLNPAVSYQGYQSSDADCTKSAKYKLPFFKTNFGPKYEEWSVNVHEARPGHHTQVQGYIEHFRDSCGGVIGWLDSVTYYTAVKEGWGYYAEYSLIGQDTDIYKNEPMQKYGMLKWQVIAALRLIIDPGLHYIGNVKRDAVLKLLNEFAWMRTEMPTDMAQKEATRYQSTPGRPTAYMIGRLKIMELRKYCEYQLGDKFSLRDFHYQILSQGTCPLAYLSDHVERYVDCVKDKAGEGCDVILNPPKKTEAST